MTTCISKGSQGMMWDSQGWQLRNQTIIILIDLIFLVVLVILLIIVWRCCLLRRDKVTSSSSMQRVIGKLAGRTRYSYQELMEATQGYSQDNLLGEGSTSAVYKGVLTNGKIVAVKKMKDAYNSSHEALLREIKTLGKLRHRNLVRVLGCVLNLDVRALVLEYMANGSLEDYINVHYELGALLQERDSCGLMSYWEMITRVGISVANALAYLHHEYDVPIIHGDVKPSNILLDSDMEPHLADFGLAKLIDRGAEAVSLSSNFKGTIGYMAPEYALAARITTKVDVYAYGVVLLVMLTGRRPTQVIPNGLSLREWVKSKLHSKGYGEENIEEVLDASLLQRSPSNIIEKSTYLLRMGLACTQDLPNDRPTIQEVLAFLNSTSWKSS